MVWFSAHTPIWKRVQIGDTYNLPCTVSIQDKLCGAMCVSKSRLNSHNGYTEKDDMLL